MLDTFAHESLPWLSRYNPTLRALVWPFGTLDGLNLPSRLAAIRSTRPWTGLSMLRRTGMMNGRVALRTLTVYETHEESRAWVALRSLGVLWVSEYDCLDMVHSSQVRAVPLYSTSFYDTRGWLAILQAFGDYIGICGWIPHRPEQVSRHHVVDPTRPRRGYESFPRPMSSSVQTGSRERYEALSHYTTFPDFSSVF
jgi:hypothetical protein